MVDLPHALQFRGDRNGSLETLKKAYKYAGKDGRVATLPDLINARVRGIEGSFGWFTTMTQMYYGLSKGGKPIIIVSHSDGPLVTDRQELEYSYGTLAQERHGNFYGTIETEFFRPLENGDYGDVHIVDAEPYLEEIYEPERHALCATIKVSERVTRDPLLMALLGRNGEQYIHMQLADLMKIRGPQRPSHNKTIFTVETVHNFSPVHNWANLVVLDSGARTRLHDRDETTLYLAIRDQEPIKKIHKEVSLSDVVSKIKEVQGTLDQLRKAADLMIDMDAFGLL